MLKVIFALLFVVFAMNTGKAQSVYSMRLEGTINPATAAYIDRSIKKASENEATCLIIHLNTPGGLLKSTRQIVSSILAAPVPVVVYVSPGGAHAGSAGVFITMAAHIAAMAPGTNIGAAHPVNMGGGTDSVMNDKSTNDAAAFIRSIAAKRNRNVEWAEEAVRKSVSIAEEEALEKKVIDLIADNERQLLARIDGRAVSTAAGEKTISSQGAEVVNVPMTTLEKFLNILSDPNIAYVLMMLGFYGLLFELYSPGAVFPGVLGGISLILAFYALHVMPLNYTGLAFIIFGIILLLLEIKVVSYGLLTIGGVTSIFLGSFFLLETDSYFQILKISLNIIIATTIFSALFFLFIGWMGLRAQRTKPASGIEGLVGLPGSTLTPLNPTGLVHVHGETWNAESLSGSLEKGRKVVVRKINGLKLFVEPVDDVTLTI